MYLRLLSLLLAANILVTATAAEKDDAFGRWNKEIAAIKERDAQEQPAPGTTVFVGSSSIRLWELKKSFPNEKFVNHGFGGSTIADSVHFIEPLVLKLKPKIVVFYAGDNDVANGLSPQQVHADFQTFVKGVHEKLPETKIVFIPIKPSPARWKLYDQQREANRLIQETIATDSRRLVYLDIVTPMLGDDRQLRAELFQKDMLHLNEAGYELWTKLLLPELK
jgi:lysophospholipase L1-like esterase